MSGASIRRVRARQVFDSRGRPTLEAEVELANGSTGRAAVPAGASTGRHEAHELRDGDPASYGGLGVLHAVSNVDQVLGPAVSGMDARDQRALDARLREVDGSLGLRRLGANAVLGVSMAVCRAGAASTGVALYRHLAGLAGVADKPRLPLPMVNVLSGGAHARQGMDVQDFLAIPIGATCLDEALAMAARVRTAAGNLLAQAGVSLLLADEGGFAPGYARAEHALDLMVRAIEAAGLRPGVDVGIGLDVAATQFVRGDGYALTREGRTLSSDEMVSRVLHWLDRYPIVSVEDPLGEDDWPAWQQLTRSAPAHCQLVGDDLFCTNPERIQRGISARVANAVLIKLNQIGTVSDTLSALALTRSAAYRPIVSARSGETEDPFIADLATATAAGQIKIGSLANSERLSKYNQLLRIQEEVGEGAFAPWTLK
ncbi:MAG TPA: phosphopyruvate hydratase [Chloroflexota bacterium]|nr:phosphopyruvate hydratase [Chloroflexota bacterium]